jgi:hypothetical protein
LPYQQQLFSQRSECGRLGSAGWIGEYHGLFLSGSSADADADANTNTNAHPDTGHGW